MNRAIRAGVASLVIGLSACGGGNSAPAAPTPTPILAANIVLSGQGSFGPCLDMATLTGPTPSSCIFAASIQNTGTGCAANTSVVARFYHGSSQVGSDAQMGTTGAGLSSRTILPNQILAIASINYIDITNVNQTQTYSLFPSWTNVACP